MLDKKLPNELLSTILEYTPPTSHLDFACTCRKFAAASQYLLQRHQEAHDNFSVASDQDPATVSLLLKSIAGLDDPIPAWHVRSLEIWYDRKMWADWADSSGNQIPRPRPGTTSDHSLVPFGLMTECLDWFEKFIEGDLEEDYQVGFEQAQCGGDGLLKALLLARLPRLQEVKFVTRSHESGTCLYWLRRLIFDCLHAQESRKECLDEAKWQSASSDWMQSKIWDDSDDEIQSISGEAAEDGLQTVNATQRGSVTHLPHCTVAYEWPIGLAGLRYVAIGVKSALDLQYDQYEDSTALFACLLRLPYLETIYFNGLRCIGPDENEGNDSGDEDYDDVNYDESSGGLGITAKDVIPAHCSSVKHMFLDGLNQSGNSTFFEAFSGAPRNLISFALRFQGPEEHLSYSDSIVRALSKFQGGPLESLMWYGYTRGTSDGYECSACHVEDLARFVNLKHVSFSMYDLEHAVIAAVCKAEYRSDYKGDWDEEEFSVRYIANAFPETLETLVLWGDSNDYFLVDEKGSVLFERAIVKMIGDGRYKALTSIFIRRPDSREQASQSSCFQDAVAAGTATGVNLYISGGGETLSHSIHFPEPVEEEDLGTRLCLDRRALGSVLDPFSGCRISQR